MYLKTSLLSIQLDESTLPGNEALCLTYMVFIKEEKFAKELLFVTIFHTDIKG